MRPTLEARLSTHLLPAYAGRGGRIILVVSPGRVMEMNDKVAVVGCDRLVKGNGTNRTPITERPPLKHRRPACFAFVRDLNLERKSPFRRTHAPIIDLRHYLVAKIQIFAMNSWLTTSNQQTHVCWGSRGFILRLCELGDRIKLADAGFFIDLTECYACEN